MIISIRRKISSKGSRMERNVKQGEGKYTNYRGEPLFSRRAFSLRLLAGVSRGLGALILALPVQQALRRVSLTSFPACRRRASRKKEFNKQKKAYGHRGVRVSGMRERETEGEKERYKAAR